jgi:hypothetical protein
MQFLGGAEKNHENLSGYLVSRPRFQKSNPIAPNMNLD